MIPSRTQNRWKRALIFALSLLPIALVGGFFTIRYQMDLYPELLEETMAELGSPAILYVIYIMQTALYACVCGVLGYVLSDGLGLLIPFKPSAKPMIFTALTALVGGVALSLLDAYVFAPYMEGYDVLDTAAANMTLDGWLAALLYGGIIEEVMLRLFFLSLIAFLLRKIFCKGMDTASLPVWLFSVANILAALLFAAGHLPATAMTFGTLTPVLLIRCFLLNGGLGLGFGWLYRKYGIGYAMLAHGGCHICMRLLFLLIL